MKFNGYICIYLYALYTHTISSSLSVGKFCTFKAEIKGRTCGARVEKVIKMCQKKPVYTHFGFNKLESRQKSSDRQRAD